MKSVAAIFLVVGCVCAQADVYKWTDERGEVHYGEHPSGANAEKVMTQRQIQREEEADKAGRQPLPPVPSGNGQSLDQEIREQAEQCQRFKSLREEFLRDEANANPNIGIIPGYSIGYLMRENIADSNELMDLTRIEANIRKFCRD